LAKEFHSWPIGAIKKPGFMRKGLVHKVTSFAGGPLDCKCFDDEVSEVLVICESMVG
jgi:hypothetical protein